MNAEEAGAKKETNYLGKLSWFIAVICSTYLVSKISKAFNFKAEVHLNVVFPPLNNTKTV